MSDIKIDKEKLKEVVKKLASFMNMECQIEIADEKSGNGRDVVLVSIYTPENAKFLIGKNGQNLLALEHLLRTAFIKEVNASLSLTVDVNDYKKSKALRVIELAKQAVARVRNTQKAEALVPMSSYERRVVHMELAACPDIATESIGEEPQRRIVIKPYIV